MTIELPRGSYNLGSIGLGLQSKHAEHAFVHAPQRLAARNTFERFEPEGVLAQRKRPLVAEVALAKPGVRIHEVPGETERGLLTLR